MEKSEKIKHIYSVFIGLFAVAMGIAFICVAADIYYSANGSGVMYSREIAADKLKALAIPFIILVGLIICGAAFPVWESKVKPQSEDALRLLSPKKPSDGEGEEFKKATTAFAKFKTARLITRYCALGVTLVFAVVSLCYILITADFAGKDISGEVMSMTAHVLPFIAAAFVALIGASVANGILSAKQVKALKTVIKFGNGKPKENSKPKILTSAENILGSNVALWVTRGVIFAAAAAFIILGIFNGGASDVLIKAINICTECIGLG